MSQIEYEPGVLRCPKCGFVGVYSNLNLSTGQISASEAKGEKCPNGCGGLWKVPKLDTNTQE